MFFAGNPDTLEVYLEPSRTSMMEIFCENNYRLNVVNYFRKKVLSWMFDWVLHTRVHLTRLMP